MTAMFHLSTPTRCRKQDNMLIYQATHSHSSFPLPARRDNNCSCTWRV